MKKIVFYSLVAGLVIIAVSMTVYKVAVLDFALTPNTAEESWSVEARVRFKAGGGPVKVSLYVPPVYQDFVSLDENITRGDYSLYEERLKYGKKVIWATRKDTGKRTFYYRLDLFKGAPERDESDSVEREERFMPEELSVNLNELVKAAHLKSADDETFLRQLIRLLKEDSGDVKLLKTFYRDKGGLPGLIGEALKREGVKYRFVQGLIKESDSKNQPLISFLQIGSGGRMVSFNYETGEKGLPDNFIAWKYGSDPLLEVIGGRDSNVTFTLLKENISMAKVATLRSTEQNRGLASFSLMTLPLNQQHTFRLLLMIPVGALIMVIMRVLVGVTTSGTFMPILFALAFQQTSLLTGLVLFMIVVAVGIWIRSLLTNLNLLLVPRIAACVIVVIFIMASISILSHQFDIEAGRAVTFFPVIILAWTVERMFIHWEESGAAAALSKIGASLLVTTFIYIALQAESIQHIMFYFPEQILTILAVIILLGSYTGFRLLELVRFSAFKEGKDD